MTMSLHIMAKCEMHRYTILEASLCYLRDPSIHKFTTVRCFYRNYYVPCKLYGVGIINVPFHEPRLMSQGQIIYSRTLRK